MKKKKILDAELWGLSITLGVVLKEMTFRNLYKVVIFSDFQMAIKKLQGLLFGRSQALKVQILNDSKQRKSK